MRRFFRTRGGIVNVLFTVLLPHVQKCRDGSNVRVDDAQRYSIRYRYYFERGRIYYMVRINSTPLQALETRGFAVSDQFSAVQPWDGPRARFTKCVQLATTVTTAIERRYP